MGAALRLGFGVTRDMSADWAAAAVFAFRGRRAFKVCTRERGTLTHAHARVCSHTCVHPPVHPAHPESAVYTPGVLGIFAGKTPKRTVVYTLHTLRASFLLRLSNTRRRMCRVRPGVHGTHPACLCVHPICVAVSAGKQAQTRSMYTLHTLRAIL